MKKKYQIIIAIILFISIIIIFMLSQTIHGYKENTSWILTQYGPNQMPQMMCFTIEGNESRIGNC